MGLYPKAITEYLSALAIPRGPNSNIYLVDPVNGDDDALGDRWTKPLKTVAAAYDKCTTNQHDVVLLVGSPTADSPTTAITWAKNFTHLVGLTSPLPGMGQRARIVNTAANDLAVLFTLSGYGCIVKNIQFYDGKDKDEDAACVLVSGNRNYFENVFFAGMGHATPAARAGSYSLKITSHENTFRDCTIGLDTIVRAAANGELVLEAASKNKFIHCEFRSYSETAGKFLVISNPGAGGACDNQFDDCLFFNFTVNWASGITNVFKMTSGGTHYIILRGNCQIVGTGTGWADTVTHIYGVGPAPDAGMGISTNPTT